MKVKSVKIGDWVEIKSWPDRARGRVDAIVGPWVTVTLTKADYHGDRIKLYKQSELEVIALGRRSDGSDTTQEKG